MDLEALPAALEAVVTFPPHPPRCAQHLLLEEKAAHGPTVPAGRRHKKYRPSRRTIGIFGGGRWISPDGDKLRLHLPRKEKYQSPKRVIGIFGGGRWIRTIEGIASRFTVCPLWPLGNSPILSIQVGGAGRRIRTPDLLITNQLLYRLSYTGVLNRTRLLYYGFRNCQALFSRISFSLGTEREQPRKGEARRKSRCLSPWDSF